MGSLPPQSPTSSTRSRMRDTGFPDGFCGVRNTSLPHPDARVGPDACITADDISVQKALSRHRRSFLAKHKRTISHGMITPDMERMYSLDLPLMREVALLDSADYGTRNLLSRSSKDGTDSLVSLEGSSPTEDDLASPITPNSFAKSSRLRNSPPVTSPERRRSFFRRLIHK